MSNVNIKKIKKALNKVVILDNEIDTLTNEFYENVDAKQKLKNLIRKRNFQAFELSTQMMYVSFKDFEKFKLSQELYDLANDKSQEIILSESGNTFKARDLWADFTHLHM